MHVSRTGRPRSDCPRRGAVSSFLSWPRSTKAFQSYQAESIEDFVLELQMIVTAFRLGLHAAKPHANPTIEAIKCFATSEEPRCKVSSSTPNNPVEFIHLCLVQVELAASEFPHLVFKFLHRLGPHAPGTAGEDKPQKGVAFSIGGHFRFLRTQMKLEPLFQHLLHKSQCLFGLARSLTENHKVIGITNKPVTGVIQLPVQIVQNNICQERRNNTALWCAD